MNAISYVMEPARFAKGMTLVRCPGDDFTSPTARLAEEFSCGRFSYREGGFLMSSVAVRHFTKAHSLGCRATARGAVEWESRDGEHFMTFSARHPRPALRAIQEMAR